MKSLTAWLFLVGLGLGALRAEAAEEASLQPEFTFARVVVPVALFRSCPEASCAVVGTAHLGAVVAMAETRIPLRDPGPWVGLELGAFALRSQLAPLLASEDIASPSDDYLHGRVRPGAAAYATPSTSAHVLRRLRAGRDLAFLTDPELQAVGWLERVKGGYVLESRVSLQHSSRLFGERNPEGPLAFVLHDTRTPDGGIVPRYARLKVLQVGASKVQTELGPLARRAVRLATLQTPPPEVSGAQKWVYVDVDEQVLSAYEGSVRVFTTLVSTGKPLKATTQGLFRVYLKTRHDRMHGEGYEVEEVPDTLYFHRSEALHGAFWHDHFGVPLTHGCVNLAPLDAAWLFAWSTPSMPMGWHSRVVVNSDEETLMVWVGRHRPEPRAREADVGAAANPAAPAHRWPVDANPALPLPGV